MKKIKKLFIIIPFIIIVFGGFFLNYTSFIESITAAFNAENREDLQKNLGSVAATINENFSFKDEFVDLYGVTANALNLDIVGNFEYIRNSDGVIQSVAPKIDFTGFKTSIKSLKEIASESNTPVIYLDLPRSYEGEGYNEYFYVFGGADEETMSYLKDIGIDILSFKDNDRINSLIADNAFFFNNDVHLSTRAEFELASATADYLSEKYGVEFYNKDIVFDEKSYTWTSHSFFGNTGRSSGRLYTDEDTFESFTPNFEVEFKTTIYDDYTVKEGGFTEAFTAKYEQSKNKSPYWVTNYGNYPKGCYEYENTKENEYANILVVSDSVFMRGNTFLALASSELTVCDPRSFGDSDFLADCMYNGGYDAIIVVGSSSAYYLSDYTSELPTDKIDIASYSVHESPEKHYYGMWTDYCNKVKPSEQGVFEISKSMDVVTLYGWAADLEIKKPLSKLYLKVGDEYLRCHYGISRKSVSDHYKNNALLKTGYSVTVPLRLLEDTGVDEVSFIMISNDGTYMYEPVVYEIRYVE